MQQNSVNRVKLGGTVTTGDTLTITVKDTSLPGGQEAVDYTVVGGDTLATIATNFAAAITANANLLALGVNAAANTSAGSVISIKSASPNITTYAQSTSGGATETISLGVTNNFVENAVIGGIKTTGNILTITVSDTALSGGLTAINYTVLASDTLTTIATGLKSAINANAGLSAAGITATSAGTAITIKSTSANATTYLQSTSAGAKVTIALSINQNGPQAIAISGSTTTTTGDTLTISVYDAGLAGGLKAVTYTVLAGDTLTTIATGLAAALTADTDLQGLGISATSAGQVVTLLSNSINPTTLRETTSAGATEQIALNVPANGVQTAVIGGTGTTNDTLTVTTFDAGLPSGSQAIAYTVLAGDTLSSIATGLATAINANTNLTAIGVTASAFSTVLNIKSASINNTTYTKSLSGGATETITLAPATSASQYSYNNLNELTAIAAGGATKFEATTNKALKSATIDSNPATLNWSKNFTGNAALSNGSNTVPVGATDGANNTVTNNYQVAVTGPSSSTQTHDANGNMTSDGTNAYAWDAENRLIKITYAGMGNKTQFTYNPYNDCVQIVETSGGTAYDTKQFVVGAGKLECRDGSGNVVSRYFSRGFTTSGSNYFYSMDHLSSIREVTTMSGIVQAQSSYDLYGQLVQTGSLPFSDFQFAGYYSHVRSNLYLTKTRPYSPSLGQWITRDWIAESGGINLYAYVGNRPSAFSDPDGTRSMGCRSVVATFLHLDEEAFPETAPRTTCFTGPDELGQANKHAKCNKCPPGQHHVVWCVTGYPAAAAGGSCPGQNDDGSVANPMGAIDHNNPGYDYAADVPGRGWGGSAGQATPNRPNPERFGNEPPVIKQGQIRMCCDSCVK